MIRFFMRILEGEKESGLLYNADNIKLKTGDKYINLISNTIKEYFMKDKGVNKTIFDLLRDEFKDTEYLKPFKK